MLEIDIKLVSVLLLLYLVINILLFVKVSVI